MPSFHRPAAVLVSAWGLGVVGLLTFGIPVKPGSAPMDAVASTRRDHDLSRLRVVHDALAPIGETYVEPERIDPERMYVEALEAVERLVPEVMFDREDGVVRAQVGSRRATLDVPRITDLRALERELRRVATLLESDLDPDDIPDPDPDVDPFTLVEFAMGNGLLATLDPHSALLPPEQSREMDVENRGEFGGLGINIEIRDDRLTVEHALPGKPAATAGVRSGDHVRRIDGQSTINLTLDEAVELLRGPVGAPVTLEVVHEGEAVPAEVVVKRGNIKINEVEGHALPGGVAYVRIPSFHSSVHADLVSQLKQLARGEPDGLRGLVLDLRDNPGGYLNQAIAVADTFLDEGEIVSTRGPHDRRPQTELARVAGTEDPYPIVVLANANSASASEIVAGALRNNQRAVIVGERTFGKGSVQNLHTLPYDSKLKVTIAHYLTPGERSIQSVGIPADIELLPVVAGERRLEGVLRPDALVFGRERVKREADLDEHLERLDGEDEQPMYVVRHLQAWTSRVGGQGPPVPAEDPELAFALDLLHVSSRPYRGDMLAAAGPLIRRWASRGEAEIQAAMEGLGLDWREGPQPAAPDLELTLQLGPDGTLHAGTTRDVRVSVTNHGAEAVHRLVAVARDHDRLDGLEFPLGRVGPGETRSWARSVRVEDGWPDEVADVRFVLRSADGATLGEQRERVTVTGLPRPHLAWSWTFEEADGSVAVGDEVRVRLSVVNLGDGASRGAIGRIRNRSGQALDVLVGTVRAGTPRHPDGSACLPSKPGVEAGHVYGAVTGVRVVSGLAPEWPEDCVRVLDPGERWEGTFAVRVLEPLGVGYRLDLTVEDERTYDHAAIVRQGFFGYYGQEQTLRFGLGALPASSPLFEPPRISLTRVPELVLDGDRLTISGRVSDDEGLDHVLVFVDDDKVFFEGSAPGEALPTLPFTASATVSPGTHTVTVLARDLDGFSSARSRVVHRPQTSWQAQVIPRDDR
ncbi:MAG: PDZ domain-containing protein [Alphaproteobacteria bacterium]|nr:PDZ domain-containing protein [Alphaproteobacteria bacterium]